jgi:hypothetical protein
VGRSEPLLTDAGVEALLKQWALQLKATDKRYPGAKQFVCDLLVSNLRVMQVGPQLALAGQIHAGEMNSARAGAMAALLSSKPKPSREKQSASVGPAKSLPFKSQSAQSSGRHSAPARAPGASRSEQKAAKGSASVTPAHTPRLDEHDESVWEVHRVLDQRTYRRQLQYQSQTKLARNKVRAESVSPRSPRQLQRNSHSQARV